MMKTKPISKPVPNVGEIRAKMPEGRHDYSTGKALALFIPNVLLYLVTFFAVIFIPSWVCKVLCTTLNGVFIATLFILGHDACHGSLTSSKRLNNLLGRLAFLPSLHPFSAWEHGHNRLHHGWSNLRDKDYCYTPLSKQEFDNLPAYRQMLERIYRTVWGVGLYYLVEIWWKHMIFPRRADMAKMNKTIFKRDRLLVAGFTLVQVAALVYTSIYSVVPSSPFLLVLVAVVWPYLFWNWIMAFVTFQHHTHPSVSWYANKDEWSFFHGQVQGTVHITFSRPIELVFHNILEHTAHHVDPKIPLYNLRASQQSLEEAYADDVIVQKGSVIHFHRVLSKCKLYDYEKYQWLDFDGKPTSEPSITAEQRVRAAKERS